MRKTALKTCLAIFIGFAALVFTGCKDQRNNPEYDRPTYPPASTTDDQRNEFDQAADTLYPGGDSNRTNSPYDSTSTNRMRDNTPERTTNTNNSGR
ncbi:hypothetical protein [Flavobacterium sp. JP2137]|uniref:hypothetical protein n=1 Tax=Flavobacterium sp. JP2137 TaxID=3414510 RepID=UPI003D300668